MLHVIISAQIEEETKHLKTTKGDVLEERAGRGRIDRLISNTTATWKPISTVIIRKSPRAWTVSAQTKAPQAARDPW
jgi:ribosome-binding ATPase YchF (GTP1/OBG family)